MLDLTSSLALMNCCGSRADPFRQLRGHLDSLRMNQGLSPEDERDRQECLSYFSVIYFVQCDEMRPANFQGNPFL
jgi:hypothetical protein